MLLGEQRAAEFRLFVAQHDLGAGQNGALRGSNTRRTGADHEHIAVHITVDIGVWVGLGGCPPKPGGVADQWFKKLRPDLRTAEP